MHYITAFALTWAARQNAVLCRGRSPIRIVARSTARSGASFIDSFCR